MSDERLARLTDAAAHAERLQEDLVRVTTALNTYRGSPGLELLRDRSHFVQNQLEAIAGRLNALGSSADSGRYPLSETEHLALEAARDLRDRMAESLARYQRAEQVEANRKPE